MDDEDLQKVVNQFISSLLPHEEYNYEFFSTNLQYVFHYIKLEEFSMEYYVLLKILSDLEKIKSSYESYVPQLTRETLENVLEISIADSILSPQIGIKEWLVYENLNSNLEIESVKQDACQKLYSRCIDLYDTCFAMKEPSEQILNKVPALKSAFTSHVANQSLIAQANIIQGSMRIGKKTYTGIQDWLDYNTQANIEINDRLRAASEDMIVTVDSLEVSSKLLSSLKKQFVPISYFGIPQIDGDDVNAGTPLLQHRFITVVGNENVGKTMFAKDQATNAILAGKKVLYMCGENAPNKMYCEILINYIYKKYNYFVLPAHIQDLALCPDNIKKVINLAAAELFETGNLILRESYNYDTLYSELVSDYDRYKPDLFIIDHSFALAGGWNGDNGKRNVDLLARDIKDFRKKYPVCCLVLSHPSTYAKACLDSDKPIEQSPTKGSQNLSTDSDDVYVLRDNTVLKKEGLISIENTKRRDAPVIQDRIILKKMFEVSHFVYDEKYQASTGSLSLEANAALQELESMYDTEDDDIYNL